MTNEPDTAGRPLVLKTFRWLVRVSVAVYFVVAIALLVLRYVVLPRIDDWRPDIEALISRQLGMPVTMAHIAADWKGLHPRVQIEGVRIDQDGDGPALALPKVTATLAWRSVLLLEPRLLYLEASGLVLSARRDSQGEFWVAGHKLPFNTDSNASHADEHPALRWLSRQRELVLRDASVHWADEQHGIKRELLLQDVQLRVLNKGLSTSLSVSAKPPVDYAAGMSVRAKLARQPQFAERVDRAVWDGQIYLQLDDADLQRWGAEQGLPPVAGRLAARAWLDLDQGVLKNVSADLAGRQLSWQPEPASPTRIHADRLDIRLAGAPADVVAAANTGQQDQAGVAVQLSAEGLSLSLPAVFETSLPTVDNLHTDFSVMRSGQHDWDVSVRNLALRNNDVALQLQGKWQSAGSSPAGFLDMQGQIDHMAMNALHRYLPIEINADARTWLKTSLLMGTVNNVAVTVRGDLAEFPFHGQAPDAGQFHLAGSFQDAWLDYAPGHDGDKGWPQLKELAGTFELDRAALRLQAQQGQVQIGDQAQLALEHASVEIANMEHDAVLNFDGSTSGQASDYLALMVQSPLGALLDHELDSAQGGGAWQVPLRLHVPLMNVDATQVEGQIHMTDSTLSLMPEIPQLSRLNGVLNFSDEGVSADTLQGEFLGGPIKVSGELSRQGQGLHLAGRLTAEAVRRMWPLPVMWRLSGAADYTAQLSWQSSGTVDLDVSSSLAGMAIDLPAPLHKSTNTHMPLRIRWGQGREQAAGRWLDVRLADTVDVLLEQNRHDSGPYFLRGGLGVKRPAPRSVQDLALDIVVPFFVVESWYQELGEFDLPDRTKNMPQAVLPDIRDLKFQGQAVQLPFMALHDVRLDVARQDASLRSHAGQSRVSAPLSWQATLVAQEADGKATWHEESASAQAQLTAHFDRLDLPLSDKTDTAESAPAGDDGWLAEGEQWRVPDLRLSIGQLSVQGRDVGALSLAADSIDHGQRLRIDNLRIEGKDAQLTGSGQWRQDGDARGLQMDLALQVSDLGHWLTQLGQPGRVSGARGEITAKLLWQGLPWHFRYIDLGGQVSLNLEKGALPKMNSYSARLLQLLSLQSVSRLAKLDVQPGEMFRDEFRFDSIRSDLLITHGSVHTEGIKIDSPIAAIVLAGDTNLTSKNWNLEAAVIPKMDASGAAIAAGIVVNPLVGLGALLTQWILKEPLTRAMTVRYTVSGTWHDPLIQVLDDGATASTP